MKLFPKKFKHLLIAALCWTSNSPSTRANYYNGNINSSNLADVSLSTEHTVSHLWADPTYSITINNDDSVTGENSVSDGDDDDFTLNNTGKNYSQNHPPSTEMTVPPHLLGRTRLPYDSDSWENIHDANIIFVDKTRFLDHFVAATSQLYFFAKPRRFGKTLFLQMIKSFFSGQKHYFNGTDVSELGNTPDKNGTWTVHPVVYINFAEITTTYFTENLPVDETMRKLHYFIDRYLRDVTEYFLKIDTTQYTEYSVSQLIFLAYEKFNLPLVILIDEYDTVITEAQNTHNKVLLDRILDNEESFYRQIKSAAAKHMVKLAMVTGVHKFAINELQSGLNSFMDISWNDAFSTSVGFTRKEIETTFKSNIADFAARLNL